MSAALTLIHDRLELRGCQPKWLKDGSLKALCPCHGDKSPSLDVRVGDSSPVAFICRAGCLNDDIVAKLGTTWKELLGLDADESRNGSGPSRQTTTWFAPSATDLLGWHQALVGNERLVRGLWESRRISEDVIRAHQIGWDRRSQRITFPILDATGELGGLTGFSSKKEPKMLARAGSKRDLFPRPEFYPAPVEILLTEGECDALAAASADISAVGVPGVSGWRKAWAERFNGHPVVVVFDCDEPGRTAAQKIAADLHAAGIAVRVVELEESRDDGYDVSDVLREPDGAERLHALLAGAPKWMQETDEPKAAGSRSDGVTSSPSASSYPRISLDSAAFSGIAGEIVRAIEPESEAAPVALLMHLLVEFGSAVGRSAHFRHEATKHYANLFAVLVGPTGDGRKGTASDWITRLMEFADPTWSENCRAAGIASGEGLTHHVRDKVTRTGKNGAVEVVDEGVQDKRLCVRESEYASVLRVSGREGSIVSPTLRSAWDHGNLRSLAKHSAERATGAHISLIGHITPDELRAELTKTDQANGYGNRHLFAWVQRSKNLPDGGRVDRVDMAAFGNRLAVALDYGKSAGELNRDADARALWHRVYSSLSAGRLGMFGALTGRAEAQVMRLALIYALLDRSEAIRLEDLEAALAVWRYCEASTASVFGDETGDPDCDRIRGLLRERPETGLSLGEFHEALQRNWPGARIKRALELLEQWRVAYRAKHETGGRPQERWFIGIPPYEINEGNEQRSVPGPPGQGLSSSSSFISYPGNTPNGAS